MKVIAITMLYAVVSGATGGALEWSLPSSLSGPIVYNASPSSVKSFGYHPSQYINAVPPAYTLGYQPHYSYQIPFSYFSTLANYPTYQPIQAPAYYPSSSFFYPQLSPIAPAGIVNPDQQTQEKPENPSEQQSNDDSEVIDSAEYSRNPQGTLHTQSAPPKVSENYLTASLDSKNMPGFPQVPQNIPQYQPFYPNEPTSVTQNPQTANDQGRSDHDSISVESA